MTTRASFFAATLSLALAVSGTSPIAAQSLSGFTASHDYVVEIDGQAAPNAKVYWSQSSRMFLILVKDQPTPLLVEPVSRQVRSVPLVKLATRADGSVAILDGAAMASKGTLDTSGGVASFTADGRSYRLVERPPLLGWQTAAGIAAYSPIYLERADAYQPRADSLAGLRKQSADVKLTVFFGSWCAHCQQKVPLAMRMARELAGSKVTIDFYGLPQGGFSSDPLAKRYGIKGVPTGIVYVDGKEVGRVVADGWATPETTFLSLVSR